MTSKKIRKLKDRNAMEEGKSRLPIIYSFAVMLLIIGMQIPMTGCTKSPAAARKELTRMHVQYTPGQFLDSAKDGNNKTVTLFLDAGMDPNVKNADGQTALMLAAYSGHTAVVKLLLAHNADTRVVDKYGDSALSWAVAEQHTEIANLLRKSEVNK